VLCHKKATYIYDILILLTILITQILTSINLHNYWGVWGGVVTPPNNSKKGSPTCGEGALELRNVVNIKEFSAKLK
jgi:hypothetical protein